MIVMRRIALGIILALGLSGSALGQMCGGGNCVAPTPPVTANNDQIATTAYVQGVLSGGLPLPTGQIFVGSAGGLATPTSTLPAAALPTPTASTLGGIQSLTCAANQWLNTVSTAGVPACAQPSASNLSDGNTGTGTIVHATSPTLVTPTIGVATATSINKMAITAPATSSTLAVANGKTATINNTLTLTGTDGTTIPFGTRTRQVFTSGSGTYTTPANVKYIRVRLSGAGGGGGGSGTTAGTGGAGGASTFSTLSAGGGGGGQGSGLNGGAGGTATGGSVNIAGGSGSSGYTGTSVQGGNGGASASGGTGYGGAPGGGSGTAGAINSGAGGGGASSASTANAGSGGGAGATCEGIITAPAATYSYAVGAAGTAGTAGTGGVAGSAGGSGIVIVDEFYQ